MVYVSAKDVTFAGCEPAKDYTERYRRKLQEVNSEGYGVPEAEAKPEGNPVPEAGTVEEKPKEEKGMPAEEKPKEAKPKEEIAPDEEEKPAGQTGTESAEKKPASPADESGKYDKNDIPMDEDGEPVYESVPKERTVEDLFGRLKDGALASEFASAKVTEAEKRLEALKKKAPKIGTKVNEYLRKKAEYEAAVKKAEESVEYWKGVKEDIERLTHTTKEELQEHAVEITNQIDKEHGKGIEGHESAGEEPVHGEGGEVLPREGSDDQGGGKVVEGHGSGEAEVRGGDHKDEAVSEETSGGGVEETKSQVDEAVKTIATEITRQTGAEVVTDENVAQKALDEAEKNGKDKTEINKNAPKGDYSKRIAIGAEFGSGAFSAVGEDSSFARTRDHRPYSRIGAKDSNGNTRTEELNGVDIYDFEAETKVLKALKKERKYPASSLIVIADDRLGNSRGKNGIVINTWRKLTENEKNAVKELLKDDEFFNGIMNSKDGEKWYDVLGKAIDEIMMGDKGADSSVRSMRSGDIGNTIKETKDDAIKRIDERIAELHRQEERPSHNTDHGNPAEPLANSEYSPEKTGAQGAASDVKVQRKAQTARDIAKKIADFIYNFDSDTGINADNFAKSFVKVIQKPTEQLSDYVRYTTENGERIVIRLSDHSGNARNIIVMGRKSDKGYSIVIRTPETETLEGTFKANKWADVKEYVYNNPDKRRLGNIAKGLFNLVDKGEYVDLAEADDYHSSPKGRKEFHGKNGEVYEFALDGKIYLDLKKMKPETPIHEYTHLWTEALKRVNPKEWENVKRLLDEAEGLKEQVQKLYPELKGDDLYEEMVATYSGREGAKKLEAEARQLAEEGKTVTESVKATTFIGKVKEALQKYWKGVADMLHIHFTSAEEVADKVLADWAKGVNPNEIEAKTKPRQRRDGFKGERKTQAEIFAEEQKKPYSGNYKEILASSKTWQEAYDRLNGKAKEYRVKAEEWRAKTYKKNGGSVEVGGKYDDLDAKNVSIDYINERRREDAIKSLEREAEELEHGAEQLKERCEKGVEPSKDPTQDIKEAADAYREENPVRPKRKISKKVRAAMESIAKDLGYNVVWHDTLEDNGYIDYKNKEIHIARDANNPLEAVFGHESTHAIRKSSEAEFAKLRDAVKKIVGEEWWNAAVKRKRALKYSEAKLEEEVTADCVGAVFHNRDMAVRLAQELHGNPGILAKVREVWHKIIGHLKSLGATEEQRQAEEALAAFEDAVKGAFKAAKEKADTERLMPGTDLRNEQGEPVVHVDGAGDIDFSHRTYKDFVDDEGNKHKGTRTSIIEHLTAQGMKEADIKKFVDNMDYWYDLTGKVADLVDKDGNFMFGTFHEWSQTSPLYKRYEGGIVRAISTLVSNGEYPLNFELSTDCIKREAFTQILNEMVNIGGTFWKKLTPAKIQELRTLQKSYGIQVACPLCFVEGKRLNIMKWATSVTEKWNDAVKKVVGDKKVTPFGFGEGTFVPDKPYDERTTPQSVVDQINEVARLVGDHDGVLPADLARMQANAKAMEEKLQEYYEDFVSKHGSGNDFSLTNAQIEELRKLRGNGGKNVVSRMVAMIATHPELQHTLDVSDLVGSKGLNEIRKRGGEAFAKLYSLIISANGTGTPKVVQDAQPYSGEIIDVSQNTFDKADKIGGARLFSFSDFDITKVFDIMQIMWDCAARNARVQSYSKEIPYILIFGKSGVKINMSMLPEARPAKELADAYRNAKGDAKKRVLERIRENAGLEMDGDKIVGLQLSDSHSVSREFAESIYRNPEYNANCGAIMVGVSANHSIYAMLQGFIRQVIPFHLSGMPISARKATDCQYYRDFTNEQNTGIIVNGRRVKAKWGENTSVKADFNFYENESEPGWNMRQRARDYVKWCADNGLVPRFEWAVNSKAYADWCRKKGYKPNQELMREMDKRTTDGVFDEYYKVLTDYTAYQPVFDADGKLVDEVPAPHKPVTGDFAVDEKILGMTLGVDAKGNLTDSNSMLANRERTIKNTDINKKEIAQKAVLLVNGKAKVKDLVKENGSQFDNNSDSDKFMEATRGEGGEVDFSKREDDRTLSQSLNDEKALSALEGLFKEDVSTAIPKRISSAEEFKSIFSNPIKTFLNETINVKEGVFNKLVRNNRTNISGAIFPTLRDADFAIRDTDGSTLYIKRFTGDNDHTYNVAVVNKYGEVEDYVSSVHIKNDNNILNKIRNGAELLLPNKRNGDERIDFS